MKVLSFLLILLLSVPVIASIGSSAEIVSRKCEVTVNEYTYRTAYLGGARESRLRALIAIPTK